jgi:hypothetical protein
MTLRRRSYAALAGLVLIFAPAAARAAEHPRPTVVPTATPTSPAASQQRDRPSGENLIGAGRSTNAVKSSGDEGGTAAGMPSNDKADGH